MSNHHNKQFFITHFRQKADAKLRREEKRLARQKEFEERRAKVQADVADWVFSQMAVMIAWFIGIAGMTISFFYHIVRRLGG